MTDKEDVETEIDAAVDRVREERSHIADKTDEYRDFRCAVEEIDFRKRSAAKGHSSALALESRSTGACEQVLRAFAETVRPYSTEDVDGSETVLETVSEELGTEMAVALSPKTDAVPPKDAVVSSVEERVLELEVVADALKDEEESLRGARTAVGDITESILENDEGRVYALGFDELRRRHERLERHKERCENVLAERQEVLCRTTNAKGAKGLERRELVAYLYDDFPTDHPVIATTTRLYGLCEDIQKSVRHEIARTV